MRPLIIMKTWSLGWGEVVVRAKMVLKAEEYPWSSVAAHYGLAKVLLLSHKFHFYNVGK